MDPADGELEPGPAGAGLGLAGLCLAALATSGHTEDAVNLKIPSHTLTADGHLFQTVHC